MMSSGMGFAAIVSIAPVLMCHMSGAMATTLTMACAGATWMMGAGAWTAI